MIKGLKRIGLFISFLCAVTTAAHAEDSFLKVKITPVLEVGVAVKNSQDFTVSTEIRNTSKEDKHLFIWLCSYFMNWKTDTGLVAVNPNSCLKNFLKDTLIKAGQSYKRELSVHTLVPVKGHPLNSITFRLGFQPQENQNESFLHTVWSNPVTIKLTE